MAEEVNAMGGEVGEAYEVILLKLDEMPAAIAKVNPAPAGHQMSAVD